MQETLEDIVRDDALLALIVEDENEFLNLLSEYRLTVEDLARFNNRLNERQVYHHSVVVGKIHQLREKNRLYYRINTDTYGSLKWGEFERILEASYANDSTGKILSGQD